MSIVVKAGACMSDGDGRVCAFQPSDCPLGKDFVTPRSLEQGGGSRTAHGGACTTRQGTEETAKIGSCNGQVCASHATVCSDPTSFLAVDDRCTIRQDGLNGQRDTRFGSCGADGQCYWSSEDCLDTSSWTTPSDSAFCTCDKVRVGACYAESFYYCAVDSTSCAATSKWINAKDLQSTANAPNCFLCHAKESMPVPTIQYESTSSPKDSPQGKQPVSSAPSSSTNKTVLAASIVGGVVTVLLVSVVIFLFRRQKGSPPINKEVSDIPVDTITGKEEEEMSDIE